MAHPFRIGIIGCAAAGLSALKVLLEQPEVETGKWDVVAFEARDDIGGVWLPSPPDLDEPPWSPMYDSLTTNIPHPLMAYQSFPFPAETPLYPRAQTVLEYLHDYAQAFNLRSRIYLLAIVKRVRWSPNSSDGAGGVWQVDVVRNSQFAGQQPDESSLQTFTFDHLVIANGHYRVPRWPSSSSASSSSTPATTTSQPLPGLDHWLSIGHASHSAFYRKPSPFRGQTIIVVGAGPSGTDILTDLARVARSLVLSLSTLQSPPVTPGNPWQTKGRIAALDLDGSTVKFEDGSVMRGVNHVLFATGYEHSLPFLEEPEGQVLTRRDIALAEPPQSDLPEKAFNTSWHVYPLAFQMFPLQTRFPPTSMSFLGLPKRVIPFPLVEAQSRVLVSVLRNSSLSDLTFARDSIVQRYSELSSTLDTSDPVVISKGWHTMKPGEEYAYRDAMLEWAGVPGWRTQPWALEINENKDALRRKWKKLEKRGQGREWVRGVETEEQWVEMMRRLMEWDDLLAPE